MSINKLPEPGEPVCVHGYSLLHDCIACDEEPKPQAPSAEWLAGWRACREAAAATLDRYATSSWAADKASQAAHHARAIRALEPPKVTP